jgi:hypothetical protein
MTSFAKNLKKLKTGQYDRQKSNFSTLFVTKRNNAGPPILSVNVPEKELIDKAREVMQRKLDGQSYTEIKKYLYDTYGYGPSTMDSIIVMMYQEIKRIAAEYIEGIVVDHYNKYEYLFKEAGDIDNERLQIQILTAKEKLLNLIHDTPTININEFFGFVEEKSKEYDINLLSDQNKQRLNDLLQKTQIKTIEI